MPKRNAVDSLQVIAMKRVSWPDGVDRKETEAYPCAEQYCRETLYKDYVTEKRSSMDKCFNYKLQSLTNSIINTWIQLSNFYASSLADFRHMEPFIKLHPVEKLDFVQEGFFLSGESNNVDSFTRFVLILPLRSATQTVSAGTWLSIVQTLQSHEATENVKELQMRLVEVDADGKTVVKDHLIHSHKISFYDFDETLTGFKNLSKLVLRGVAHDECLEAIGTNCHFLVHLDIRGCEASKIGVRLLFYKSKQLLKDYVKRFNNGMAWSLSKQFLCPLTKSLRYFDMSDIENVRGLKSKLGDEIKMACPQLVATPTGLFFAPKGKAKVICEYFDASPTFVPLRQVLILNIRSKFCEDLFCLVRSLLACSTVTDPVFETRVDEFAYEVGFLLYSKGRLISYCELENLTVINFTNYTKSTTNFIPIDVLGHFAPKLQRIKASLKGTVGRKYPLKYLKHVAMPIAHDMNLVKSIVQNCPDLIYLEILELFLHLEQVDDDDMYNVFQFGADALQVFRMSFRNKVTVMGGLNVLVEKCPKLRLVGDLKFWAVNEANFYRLHKQVGFHNFDLFVEYNGVLHKNGKSTMEITL